MGCYVMTEILETCEASEADFIEIRELYKTLSSDKCLQKDEYKKSWYQLKNGSDFFKNYITKVDDVIVASCCISIIPNITKNGKPYAVIENIVVNTKFRGRDFEKAVIEESLRYAKSCQCYKVIILNNLKEFQASDFCSSPGISGNSKEGFVIRFE